MLMYLYPFFAALFVTSLIVVTKPLHMHMTAKSRNMSARQSLHIIPTPRVGGLSLVIGYIVGMLFLPVDVFDLTMLLGISTIPVFLGGFGEDMGFDVSSTKRLILSFISAVLAILVFQTWVTEFVYRICGL
jgi:UDP-N-acetylmuramyl pentapeptide phosphotransferase/UDP-N-acetylglucosamine-1-phosphate transferase